MSNFPEMEYETDGEGVVVDPNILPRDFLAGVMRDPRQPMARRMKAAEAILGYYHPKLSAVAIVERNDFATMLDRAIARSGKGEEVKQIDLTPEGPVRRRPKEARG
jgi:hypothetical protein